MGTQSWLEVDRSALQGKGDPRERFVGDPRDGDVYGEAYESGRRSALWEAGYEAGKKASLKGKPPSGGQVRGEMPCTGG